MENKIQIKTFFDYETDYFVIGIGNETKDTIKELENLNYPNCKFIWVENLNEITFPKLKVIFFIFDTINRNILKKIESCYYKGNLTLLYSPFDLEKIINKNFFDSQRIGPIEWFLKDIHFFLDVILTHGHIEIGDKDILHNFCNSKNYSIWRKTVDTCREDAEWLKNLIQSFINTVKLFITQYILIDISYNENSCLKNKEYSMISKYMVEHPMLKDKEFALKYRFDNSLKNNKLEIKCIIIGSLIKI